METTHFRWLFIHIFSGILNMHLINDNIKISLSFNLPPWTFLSLLLKSWLNSSIFFKPIAYSSKSKWSKLLMLNFISFWCNIIIVVFRLFYTSITVKFLIYYPIIHLTRIRIVNIWWTNFSNWCTFRCILIRFSYFLISWNLIILTCSWNTFILKTVINITIANFLFFLFNFKFLW